jgi:hypothetical protein
MPKAKSQSTDWLSTSQQVNPWWQSALNQGIANQSFTTVKLGSPQHIAWRKYFAQTGWTPACMSLAQCTMPTQWPPS